MRRAVVLAAAIAVASVDAPLSQNLLKEAVVETSLGTFVIDLDPAAAPNQVAYFTKLAAEGAYDNTTFHRMVKYGIVQGGDPLTKDPAKRPQYGTGGLNMAAENAERAESGDRREPRDFHDNADEIFEPDVIADLERAGIDRLWPDARGAQLLLGIVEVREDDLPRHLAVNADWLDLLQDRVAGSFEHMPLRSG